MRRPLFGTGYPQRVPFVTPGVPSPLGLTVFDAALLDPNYNYAVTLYVWAWTKTVISADTSKLPILVSALTDSTSAFYDASSRVLTQRYISNFESIELANTGVVTPVKLLDRVLVRGKNKIVIANININADATPCWVYGYFETVGVKPVQVPFRPLQPIANVVAPASSGVTLVEIPPGGVSAYSTVHQVTPQYVDIVKLDVNYGAISADVSAATEVFVKMPNGEKLPLPLSPLLQQASVFDGIPMRAESRDPENIQVGLDGNTSAAVAGAAAYGHFNRV